MRNSYLKDCLFICIALILLWACANVGNPEGGPFDTTAPRLVSSKPEARALHVQTSKINLDFDEFIKLMQQDKIIISPPQKKSPIISAIGKSISVKLIDSLRANTTYSIYFDDAVVDNNEANPLENLEFYFSTGDKIDTMRLAGVVLDAENLEPIPNLVVGAYFDDIEQDSIALKKSFLFAGKTNKQGRFAIRGLTDSVYRIFALRDNDNDFRYNGLSEGFAFLNERFRTSKLDSIKTDTIKIDSIVRRDTLYRDSLVTYNYTYYKPDDVVLRYFTPQDKRLGLERSLREDSLRITLSFTENITQVPQLISLDKPTALPQELYFAGIRDNKTATYWLRDSTLITADSVRFVLTYSKTDSLMNRVEQTDTLTFVKPRAKETKKKSKDENTETSNPFELTFRSAGNINSSTLRDSLILRANLPIDRLDKRHIRLEFTQDSLYKKLSFRLRQDSLDALQYYIEFDRVYGGKYRVTIDSAKIHSIYGHSCNALSFEQKVEGEGSFGALELNILNLNLDKTYVAQLLDKSGKPLLNQKLLPPSTKEDTVLEPSPSSSDNIQEINIQENTVAKMTTETKSIPKWQLVFNDLKPDTYYLRMFVDDNGDGVWTTGDYPRRMPELMYYSPYKYEVKKAFTTKEDWNPYELPLHKQKPLELLKNKPEEKKKREDKNIEYYKRIEEKKRK